MTKREDQGRRLGEAKILAGMLADRMMAAYVVGGRPTEVEIQALCRAVLLLEEHGVALPPFVDDVIARLQAQDEAGSAAASVIPKAPAGAVRTRMLGTMLRPFRMRLAA